MIITDTADLTTLAERFLQSQFIAVDTETTGVERFCDCVGVAITDSYDTGIYIPIKIFRNNELVTPWSKDALIRISNFLKLVLTNKKNLILHNAVFDAKVFTNSFGIDILPFVFCDTMLLAHTVHNEEGPFGLKPLAALLLDPAANETKDEVRESVRANGGSVTKANFEMYKADFKVLGKYAAYDVKWTYGLFEKLYPEISSQNLDDLWNNEVMALLEVSYDLNTTGINIDLDYFKKLKEEISSNIKDIEYSIYEEIKDQTAAYELDRIFEDVKLTERSTLGRKLKELQISLDRNNKTVQQIAREMWLEKNETTRVFNLDSTADKAFLIYNILNIPVEKETKSGKPATDKNTIEELCVKYAESSRVLKMLLHRAKEKKLLSTYVEAILHNTENGRLYPSFNQVATVSGRYASFGALNAQTLPRDDKRIKSGFIPDPGWVFVAADYAQLEPRCFAAVSKEETLQKIFTSGEDFYSRIAIDVFKIKDASATETADNYLKKKYPDKRQTGKVIALAIPYGAGAYRLKDILHMEVEDTQHIIDKYLDAYPNLKVWMQDSESQAIKKGYVTSIAGRKRRTNIVNQLYSRLNLSNFTRKNCQAVINKLGSFNDITDGVDLYLAAKNSLNNAKNCQIQSLAASICNAAMIDFKKKAKDLGLSAKVMMQIHDEIVITCPKNEAATVAKLLQECMESNKITRLINVPMSAEPVITEKSLAEAK